MYTFYLALFNCSTIERIIGFVALFNIAIVFNCSTIQRIVGTIQRIIVSQKRLLELLIFNQNISIPTPIQAI